MANPIDGSPVFATEHQFQAACVEYYNHNYRFTHPRMLHANNNNSVDRAAGNKNKALGVMSGVSDLELILDHGKTCYIELKLPGKTQSSEQIEFENELLKRGHWYVIFDTLNQFKEFLWTILGKPMMG